MQTEVEPAGQPFKSPRAAAVAGILFSVLFLAALVLLLRVASIRPLDSTDWIGEQSWKVGVALNLIPFSGVAFLWFVGVMRDRLGAREDRLVATVFLGSGLLFVGLIFVSASVLGALVLGLAGTQPAPEYSPAIHVIRRLAYNLANIYALTMAAVFMVTASTLILRTRFTARWVAVVGYSAAGIIVLGGQTLDLAIYVFPLWVLIVSVNILFEAYRSS